MLRPIKTDLREYRVMYVKLDFGTIWVYLEKNIATKPYLLKFTPIYSYYCISKNRIRPHQDSCPQTYQYKTMFTNIKKNFSLSKNFKKKLKIFIIINILITKKK